jgi:hypothetical protein
MACDDPKRREFMNVAVGSTDELSVSGPPALPHLRISMMCRPSEKPQGRTS